MSCGDEISEVIFQLYQGEAGLVKRRFDPTPPYFFFRDNGTDIGNGFIAPGTYDLRVIIVNAGIRHRTPFTRFTIEGGCFP